MTLNIVVSFIIIILILVSFIIWLGYILDSSIAQILKGITIKRFKNIVIEIILREDEKSALQILSDEYSKLRINTPTFSLLIGNISTGLRSGDYSKYYKKSIEDPMNLAKKLDTILSLYDDKTVIDQFKQSDFIKELEIDSDKRMTNQDILMIYGKINAYYQGRIYEKNTEINRLKKKVTKTTLSKILAILGYVIGFISGVLTIVSYFLK